ncbi:hypothetical protein DW133_04895 [Sutterella sp. AM11-39]|nr:hypothetical protein DW133_04895 [Sutterella sp. AM11-39]
MKVSLIFCFLSVDSLDGIVSARSEAAWEIIGQKVSEKSGESKQLSLESLTLNKKKPPRPKPRRIANQ